MKKIQYFHINGLIVFIIILFIFGLKLYISSSDDIDARWIVLPFFALIIPIWFIIWIFGTIALFKKKKTGQKVIFLK